jgi:hypothetical protein
VARQPFVEIGGPADIGQVAVLAGPAEDINEAIRHFVVVPALRSLRSRESAAVMIAK